MLRPCVALLAVLLSGCAAGVEETSFSGAAAGRAQTQPPRRYLALGDSYTIGQSVKGRERWPLQLAASVRASGVSLADPLIIAETGWTSVDLMRAMDEVKPQGPFALVTVLIGVNDQYQGRDLDAYRQELRQLLQRSAALANCDSSRVIVLSIPDWSVTPFAAGRDRARVATEIARFNAVNRDEAARAGMRQVDVTPQSRRAGEDRTLLADDGLHPSAKMYAGWVELARPVVLEVLARPEVSSCEPP